jgi:hypothetical protein
MISYQIQTEFSRSSLTLKWGGRHKGSANLKIVTSDREGQDRQVVGRCVMRLEARRTEHPLYVPSKVG